MSASTIQAPATGRAHVYTVRRPLRGWACLVSPQLPRPSTGRWLKALTVAFDAICVSGAAALVWSVVAGLQPVMVITHLS